MDKAYIRKLVKERLEAFDGKEEEESAIIEMLRSLDEYKKSRVVLSYASLQDEVNLEKLYEDGKTFLFPYVDGSLMHFAPSPLKRGAFGIMEPEERVPFEYEEAVILIPGRAFSKDSYRIGRGMGYYDRYLKTHRNKLFSVGICYSVQLFDCLPHDSWDEKPDLILSGGERIPAF